MPVTIPEAPVEEAEAPVTEVIEVKPKQFQSTYYVTILDDCNLDMDHPEIKCLWVMLLINHVLKGSQIFLFLPTFNLIQNSISVLNY